MINEPISNIHVSLDIPSNRIMAASQHVFDQYTDIVEDALKETQHKLLFDEEFQKHIKKYVQEAVERAMKTGLEDMAQSIVDGAYYDHYNELKKKVRNVVTSFINEDKNEVL